MLTVNELAKLSDTKPSVVRYYTRRGSSVCHLIESHQAEPQRD